MINNNYFKKYFSLNTNIILSINQLFFKLIKKKI